MSYYERNKGTLLLKATGVEDIEKFCSDILSMDKYRNEDIGHYRNSMVALVNFSYDIEPEFMIINNSLYEVKYTVKDEELEDGFAEVTTSLSDPSNIDFHTMHYNGGPCLDGIIEEQLKENNEKNK